MEFNQDGIKIRTFTEIIDKKVAEYKAIYGDDINTEQNTQDGQKIGIEANAILDIELFAQWLYANLDADFTEGQMLNIMAKISGITRQPGARSSVDVEIITDRPLTLPVDWEAKDVNDAIWFTPNELILAQGTNQITLSSKDWGAINAQANEVIFQNHIVLGIISLANALPSVLGIEEESDADFRIRRNLSTENPAFSTIGELQSGLSNLNSVTDVKIYENKTDVLDTVLDLQAHSIWIIVDGGSISDISKTIAISKTAGAGEKGSITGSYVEEIITDLGSFFYTHEPIFDRPTSLSTELIFTVTPTFGVVDLAKFEPLKDLEFKIGADVIVTDLYSEIYKLHNQIQAENLAVTNSNGTGVTNIAIVNPNERFKIDTLTITVL
jgi:uncharacterized phage protein gp47/JayE